MNTVAAGPRAPRLIVGPIWIILCLAGFAASRPAQADGALQGASAEVAPLLAQMGAAANAHDVERHVGFYARDPSTVLISNGEAIVGWEAIRDRQREWWKNGNTDVVYAMQGKPHFRSPAPGIVVSTLFMKSRRTMPDGSVKEGDLAVSALWQKRPEGWRIIYSHESTSH